MKEKFLPIGTVVMLKGGTKRIMVNGFCAIDPAQPNVMFDYSGVLFPEGALSSDQALLFNHSQIKDILHMGLEDDEQRKFNLRMKLLLEKLQEQSNANNSNNSNNSNNNGNNAQ